MRLGQMARKLAVSPSEIIQFLATQHISVDENANTRLEDIHVEMLQRKFAPLVVFSQAVPPLAVEIVPEASVPESETVTPIHIHPIESDKAPDVIKAPKIALSGLKVLGKIELPDAKKKDDDLKELPDNQELTNTTPRVERKAGNLPKKAVHYHKQYKNPVALQREKETQEELDRRKEMAAREKERKTKNYLKKVKLSPPTKAVRLVEEPVMQMTDAELKEEPKSWWGKLVKWVST